MFKNRNRPRRSKAICGRIYIDDGTNAEADLREMLKGYRRGNYR